MTSISSFFSSLSPVDQDERLPLSFGLAVGVHLVALLILLLPSSLFHRRPLIEEVQTINLFTAEELRQQTNPAPPVKRPPAAIKKPPPPEPQPKAQSIAQQPEQVQAEPTPAEVVSLSPRATKIKITEPKPKRNDEAIHQKALERIKARLNEKREEERVKHELARLRNSILASNTRPQAGAQEIAETGSATGEESAPSRGEASSAALDIALKRYYIAISRKIHEHWVLPEMQKWDDTLEALYVIVVRQDGIIGKRYFEKKSGNSYFDQFVEKSIEAAAPLPHFPADLREKELEIGLRFHPSGLF